MILQLTIMISSGRMLQKSAHIVKPKIVKQLQDFRAEQHSKHANYHNKQKQPPEVFYEKRCS